MEVGVHGIAADLVWLEKKKVDNDKNRQGDDDGFNNIEENIAKPAKKAHKLIMLKIELAFKREIC